MKVNGNRFWMGTKVNENAVDCLSESMWEKNDKISTPLQQISNPSCMENSQSYVSLLGLYLLAVDGQF